MQNLKIAILLMLCFISLKGLAQGVPKAYEAINYYGKANGRPVKFVLADGYIGASSIKMYIKTQNKPVFFEPDAGTADEQGRLKFVAGNPGNFGYFVLDNMQGAYDDTPAVITGIYIFNGKKVPVKFGLVKPRRH
ncbi:MAG: hypothetical protein ACXVJD_13965 [Mucilaginibacter sp.]